MDLIGDRYRLAKDYALWHDRLYAAPVGSFLFFSTVLSALAASGQFPEAHEYGLLCFASGACSAFAGVVAAFRQHEK